MNQKVFLVGATLVVIMVVVLILNKSGEIKDDWVEGVVNASVEGSFVTVKIEKATGYYKKNFSNYISFPIDLNTIIENGKGNMISVGDKVKVYYRLGEAQAVTTRIVIY